MKASDCTVMEAPYFADVDEGGYQQQQHRISLGKTSRPVSNFRMNILTAVGSDARCPALGR